MRPAAAACAFACLTVLAQADAAALSRPIFDGRTLDGWSGAPGIWHVQDGCIVGESTPSLVSGDTFLIWTGGAPADFDLSAQVRMEGADGSNSGIQYRSRHAPFPHLAVMTAPHPPPGPGAGPVRLLFNPAFARWNLAGYQADVSVEGMGQLFDGGGPPARGIVAKAGEVARLPPDGAPEVLGHLDIPAGGTSIGQWHTLRIVARGHTLLHFVDGSLRSVTIDDDPARRADRGLIGLQLETTASATVWVKDIRLRVLDSTADRAPPQR